LARLLRSCKDCETKSGDVCYCPVEGVIEVVGRRYALQIIGLVGNHGSLRFKDIQSHFRRLSSRTLSERLRELESEGILLRKSYPEIPPRVEYSLTRKGTQFRELIKPLMEWAAITER